MERIKFVFSLIKESFSEFMDDNGLKLSAALSYYTIFSLAPMLLLIISIVSIFFGREAFQGELFGQISGLVGKEAAAQVQELIKNAAITNKSNMAATIGVITLLIGATGVFAEIQDSINYIWSIKSKPQKSWLQYLKNRLLSFSIILTLGFLLIVSLGINAIVDVLSGRLERYFSEVSVIIFSILNVGLVLVIIAALFTVIFKVLPDGHVRWKECMVGAVFTSIMFAIGKFAISFYLGQSNLGAAYGTSASIVILLTWIYYSSIILYFGAEFTKVYAKVDGVSISPNEHAVLMVRKEVEKEGPGVNRSEGKKKDFTGHKNGESSFFKDLIDRGLHKLKKDAEAVLVKLFTPATYYIIAGVIALVVLNILIFFFVQFLNESIGNEYLGLAIILALVVMMVIIMWRFKKGVLDMIRRTLIRLGKD